MRTSLAPSDWVSRCDCHHIQNGNQTAALSSPEATDHQLFTPEVVWQTDWTHARTSKLLFTGGVQAMWNNIDNSFPSEQGPNAVSITEDTTGLVYGAEAGAFYTHTYRNKAESRAAVNYVTGSHALKAGVNFVSEWGQHTLTRVAPPGLKRSWYRCSRGWRPWLVAVAPPGLTSISHSRSRALKRALPVP